MTTIGVLLSGSGVKDGSEIHVDEKNTLITTPAYMLGPGIKDVAVGIEKLVDKIMDIAINT